MIMIELISWIFRGEPIVWNEAERGSYVYSYVTSTVQYSIDQVKSGLGRCLPDFTIRG